jgi:hypothetical protein
VRCSGVSGRREGLDGSVVGDVGLLGGQRRSLPRHASTRAVGPHRFLYRSLGVSPCFNAAVPSVGYRCRPPQVIEEERRERNGNSERGDGAPGAVLIGAPRAITPRPEKGSV